jgi:phospholipid/cholesterol/gamma-HCH transport system substrate-binding protein
MKNVNALAGMIGGKSSEISLFVDNLASLSEKFSSIADKVDTTMTEVSSIADSVSKSDIEGLVASFNTLLESINDPDGTIGKLLVDKSVYDSVDTLLADVDSLVRKIQENPKKYIKISVF